MTVPSGAEFARLSALIARQRVSCDRLQSGAAARSVVDLARGMLMERLGCSPAEAQAQLEHLSAESGHEPGRARRRRSPGQAHGATGGGRPDADAAAGRHGRWHDAQHSPGRPGRGRRGGRARRRAASPPPCSRRHWPRRARWPSPCGWLSPTAAWNWPGRPGSRPATPAAGGASTRTWTRPPQRAADEGAEYWWPAGRPGGRAGPACWAAGRRAPARCCRCPARGWPSARWRSAGPARWTTSPSRCGATSGHRRRRARRRWRHRLPGGDLAADDRAWWAFGLLDSLLGSAMYARAVRDDGGQVTDFRISYLSEGFADPAGP